MNPQNTRKKSNIPFDVLLLREETLEDAFLAEEVTFLAREGLDERLEADATDVERLDGVFPEPFSLGSIAELPLLIVGEEGEIVVVLRVTLRHLCLPFFLSLSLSMSMNLSVYESVSL